MLVPVRELTTTFTVLLGVSFRPLPTNMQTLWLLSNLFLKPVNFSLPFPMGYIHLVFENVPTTLVNLVRGTFSNLGKEQSTLTPSASSNTKSSHQKNRGHKGPGQCTFCTSVQHRYFRLSCFFHSFPMSCMYDTYILSVLRASTPEHKVAKIKTKTKAKAKKKKKINKRTLNKKNRGLDKRLKTDGGGIIKKVHKYNTMICNRSRGSRFQALSFRLSFLPFSSIGLSCFFR